MVLGITPNTKFVYSLKNKIKACILMQAFILFCQTVDKALLLQGFAIVGTAFLI